MNEHVGEVADVTSAYYWDGFCLGTRRPLDFRLGRGHENPTAINHSGVFKKD